MNTRWGSGTMRIASVPVDPSWGMEEGTRQNRRAVDGLL
ncbi:hypothetical protein [Pseudomonas asplenii]